MKHGLSEKSVACLGTGDVWQYLSGDTGYSVVWLRHCVIRETMFFRHRGMKQCDFRIIDSASGEEPIYHCILFGPTRAHDSDARAFGIQETYS